MHRRWNHSFNQDGEEEMVQKGFTEEFTIIWDFIAAWEEMGISGKRRYPMFTGQNSSG